MYALHCFLTRKPVAPPCTCIGLQASLYRSNMAETLTSCLSASKAEVASCGQLFTTPMKTHLRHPWKHIYDSAMAAFGASFESETSIEDIKENKRKARQEVVEKVRNDNVLKRYPRVVAPECWLSKDVP